MRKHKLKLHHETLRILAGTNLERARGGFLTTIIIVGDGSQDCKPPPTNSIAPCCASLHGACPAE